MAVHLITVVGGNVDVLPHMLAHYRELGIESFFVNLHLSREDDPVREQVEAITRADGCGIASIKIGDWQTVQQDLYLRHREKYPDDWFVLADQDELQRWPARVSDVVAGNWDYVRGCFVDRISADGGFPRVEATRIWEQFPLGGVITGWVLGGDPRKVVAVKGKLPLTKGQHHAYSGRACPSRELYVPVHHFKWTENVIERLMRRAEALHSGGFPQWAESAQFVRYCMEHGGRIDVNDPRLMIARCDPDYPHWVTVKQIALKSQVLL